MRSNSPAQESSKLLSKLIRAAPSLAKPYVEPLMKSLLPKLRDPDPGMRAPLCIFTRCMLISLSALAVLFVVYALIDSLLASSVTFKCYV